MTVKIHTYTRSTGFFDELLCLLVSTSSFGIAAFAKAQGLARLPERDHYSAMEGPVTQTLMSFFPRETLIAVLSNQVVHRIELHEDPLTPCAMTQPLDVNYPDVQNALMSMAFISYYERHVEQVSANHGGRAQGWPPVWNFGRVIRNAFAHGGIKIKNSSLPPVTWRGLSYDASNNGTRVLAPNSNVGVADLIHLMADMDASI